MSEHSKERQTAAEFEQINPAKIAITSQSPEQPDKTLEQEAAAGGRRWIIACVAVSVVLVLLVFILLPRMVSKPELAIDAPVAKTPAVQEVSPWQEAQKAKERKAAQEVLSLLLDKQFELEEAQVTLWGLEGYERAAELAKQGDESYRHQAFTEASDSYRQALAILAELLANKSQIIMDKINAGYAQLHAGNAATAAELFQQVVAIEPGNAKAGKGLRRTETLDQVLALTAQALAEEQNNQLDRAKTLLEEAKTLDGDAAEVGVALTRINEKRLARDFTQAMSAGYGALESADFKSARQAFQRALKLKPGAAEAQSGLEEVAHRISQNKIAAYRADAEQLVGREQWQAALEKYQTLLQVDGSLLFAQQGRDQAADRARLDQLLEEQINHPERLASDQVFQEAGALLKVAATVGQPGPRLQQQMSRLEILMKEARTPVAVEISSDNRTNVVLYRSGSLGNFLKHQLSLLPGKYVLVGKRDGFRDVRKEFVVSANQPPLSINIQCTEKI